MQQRGAFFSIKPNNCNVKLKIDNARTSQNNPFFSVLDDDKTIKLFLDALANNRYEDAKAYISKRCSYEFDFQELSNFFDRTDNYKCLLNMPFSKAPKNCKIKSLLVMKTINNSKENSIIHLQMIEEPDKFGKWKIYGIEKE